MRSAVAFSRMRLPRLGIGPQIVALVLILGLVGAMAIQPTRQLLAQRRRIEGMANDLADIQRMNGKLEARIERLQDPDFIEQRAREQAGLVRQGETTFVVIPPSRKVLRRKARARAARREPPPAPAPEPGFVEGFFDFVGLH